MVKRNKTRGNKTIRNKTRRNKTITKGGAWKVKKTKIDIKFDLCEKKYCKDKLSFNLSNLSSDEQIILMIFIWICIKNNYIRNK